MDGDYSSSSAAGNSHSCCGDDVFFSLFRYPSSRAPARIAPWLPSLRWIKDAHPDNPCIICLSYA